jgi:hypothetical protein
MTLISEFKSVEVRSSTGQSQTPEIGSGRKISFLTAGSFPENSLPCAERGTFLKELPPSGVYIRGT